MNCKFCNAVLEEDVTVCPECGKELCETEELTAAAELVEEATCEQACSCEESSDEECTCEMCTCEESSEETCSCEECNCCTSDCEQEEGTELEEAPPAKKKTGKIIAMAVGCVVLALVLIGAVLYGLGIDILPKANDVMYKEDFTVTDEEGAKQANTVIATAGGLELTNAELQIFYWDCVENYLSYYGDYLEYVGLNANMPLNEQVYDAQTGKTWQQYFLENTLQTWHRYASLSLMAEEEGYEFSETTKNALDAIPEQVETAAQSNMFESGEDMIQSFWSAVCNLEGYKGYMNTNLKGMDYYSYRYTQIQPTAEEIQSHFTENEAKFTEMGVTADSGKLVDVRHILIKPEATTAEDGTTTYSDEAWETCRESAQALLDEYLAGDMTEESFAQMAAEHTEDPGSANTGGLYSDVYVGQMVEPFEDWCFDESRQVGDTGLVQTNYGYHIMYFVGSDEIWYVNAQTDLINQRTEQILVDAQERWPMKVNYKKIVLGNTGDVLG